MNRNYAKNPDISIVVPVKNEENNVEILYNEIRDYLAPLNKPYEVIFIDDGSTDSTLEKLKSIRANEKCEKDFLSQTMVIQFTRNFGQTAAMQAGFDLAKGDIIVTLDGDLQNDPKDIPKLLNELKKGYDIVCGWRKKRKDTALTRTFPSIIANWLIRGLIGVSIHDIGCSLKAYKSAVIKPVNLYSDMHRFIPVVTSMIGAKITEIVVDHRPRKFGKTKYGLSRTWKVLLDLVTLKMLINFRYSPIRWFVIFGSGYGMFGLALGIASVVIFLEGIQSMIFLAASFLVCFLYGSLIFWGLLAEYIISQEK